MAILRIDDIRKMNKKDLEEKIKDLRLELIKANVTANKSKAKTKELKRALSRCMTVQSAGEDSSK